MENVNKIQIRLDSIKSSGATISIPFGLEFFPVDNSELQETEFVEKEIDKAINPIFDDEKYPFYPTDNQTNRIMAYEIEFQISAFTYSLASLGLTDDDIRYNRNPLKKTYLRLNFYDSKDTKVQNLVAKETVHLHIKDSWFTKGKLNSQTTIPLTFIANFNELLYNSKEGEGYNFYWFKNNLPTTLYIKPSIMNAKTGKILNLYSRAAGELASGVHPSLPVAVTSGGFNYIKCDFYSDLTKKQQYFYTLNSDGISKITFTNPLPASIQDYINNKITIILYPY